VIPLALSRYKSMVTCFSFVSATSRNPWVNFQPLLTMTSDRFAPAKPTPVPSLRIQLFSDIPIKATSASEVSTLVEC
jgi:hypothetical protein